MTKEKNTRKFKSLDGREWTLPDLNKMAWQVVVSILLYNILLKLDEKDT